MQAVLYAMKLHALSWLENQFIEPYSITVYLIIKWQARRNEKNIRGEQLHQLSESAHSDWKRTNASSKNCLGPSRQDSIRSDGPVVYFFFKVLCTACETPCCLKPCLLLKLWGVSTYYMLGYVSTFDLGIFYKLYKTNKSNQYYNISAGLPFITRELRYSIWYLISIHRPY